MSHLSHIKMIKSFFLCCIWIRLITAFLLYARELWKNNAWALRFWCLSNALTLQVRALDASKTWRVCIILSQFTRKSKYAVKTRWNWRPENLDSYSKMLAVCNPLPHEHSCFWGNEKLSNRSMAKCCYKSCIAQRLEKTSRVFHARWQHRV